MLADMRADTAETWIALGYGITAAPDADGPNPAWALPPAPWLDDDRAVERRIAAKAYDDLGGDVWRAVVHLVRLCSALVYRHGLAPGLEVACSAAAAVHAAQALASLLPPPPPQSRPWPPRRRRRAGPVAVTTGPVAAAADRLMAEVGTRSWTCPSVLSGAVDDALRALRAFRRDLLTPRSETRFVCPG